MNFPVSNIAMIKLYVNYLHVVIPHTLHYPRTTVWTVVAYNLFHNIQKPSFETLVFIGYVISTKVFIESELYCVRFALSKLNLFDELKVSHPSLSHEITLRALGLIVYILFFKILFSKQIVAGTKFLIALIGGFIVSYTT